MEATTEEPSWLQAAVDQRLAFIKEKGAIEMGKEQGAIIAVFLTEPGPFVEAGGPEHQRWEFSCDNCGKYCPGKNDTDNGLWSGHVLREVDGVKVAVTFGACAACKNA